MGLSIFWSGMMLTMARVVEGDDVDRPPFSKDPEAWYLVAHHYELVQVVTWG
jgi:hypothetical protein